jgi:DNA-binding NtrC family response regulator
VTERETRTLPRPSSSLGALSVNRFRLAVLTPAAQQRVWESTSDRCSIGSHPSNELVLDDDTVSGFHCELAMTADGAEIKDMQSRNGTFVDGLRVRSAFLRDGSLLRLGEATVRFEIAPETNRIMLSERAQFGLLSGWSPAMRSVFAILEAAATRDVTLLLQGETGTGKGAAADSVHRASKRAQGPFVVVDCSAISPTLLESELFGHEKGAFTGANERRVGALEEASGGTVFLDEIGELPLDLQPKFLRALENREVKRVGSNSYQPINVRVIAATNRDLRAEVNAGRFRSDLFYRVAVVKLTLPALRDRSEDIPLIAEQLLASFGLKEAELQTLLTPKLISRLQSNAWPGNVRELRNYLERCLVLGDVPISDPRPAPAGTKLPIDPTLPFAEARRRVLDQFEREYVEALLDLHQGKVQVAANAAGVTRVHLWRLAKRRVTPE